VEGKGKQGDLQIEKKQRPGNQLDQAKNHPAATPQREPEERKKERQRVLRHQGIEVGKTPFKQYPSRMKQKAFLLKGRHVNFHGQGKGAGRGRLKGPVPPPINPTKRWKGKTVTIWHLVGKAQGGEANVKFYRVGSWSWGVGGGGGVGGGCGARGGGCWFVVFCLGRRVVFAFLAGVWGGGGGGVDREM